MFWKRKDTVALAEKNANKGLQVIEDLMDNLSIVKEVSNREQAKVNADINRLKIVEKRHKDASAFVDKLLKI